MVAAVAPTARVAHLGAAAATMAFTAVPAVVAVARGDAVVSSPLIVVAVVGGATLGWAVEDPAAQLLASLPVPNATRTALRAALVACVVGIGAMLTVLVVALGPGLPPDLRDRVPEAAASAGMSLAVGLVVARGGERGAGPIAVTAGVLGTAFVAALAYRWPALFPTFSRGPTHDRWWIIAFVGLAVAVHAGRDVGRR